MRALVISGPGSARVEDVAEPVPGAGQVVVDVRRAGICGTDVELFTGQLAYFAQGKIGFPIRPGHEWCGVVSALGDGVDSGWLGTRVTGDTMLGCGRCRRCAAGRGHVCADRREVGIMGWPGAVAEKMPARVSSLHRLPDAIDDRAGALVEPGGNGWRAATAAQAEPGKRILVCGPGTIGLLTTAFATAMGAEVHIWALGRDREELAASFGASAYWTAGDPPPAGYDAVVDCTDDHRVPAAALALAEPAGRLVYIGISAMPSLIDSRDLVLGDMTAVGILGASAGLAPAIEHYADGRVDPSRIVGVTVGLDRAAEALAGRISTGAGPKIHIDPRALGPGRPGGRVRRSGRRSGTGLAAAAGDRRRAREPVGSGGSWNAAMAGERGFACALGFAVFGEEGAELVDRLVLVGAEVFDHGQVGAGPVGAAIVAAAGGRGHQEMVVRDLDVVAHLVPGDRGRHQADGGPAAVVELQVLEHGASLRLAVRTILRRVPSSFGIKMRKRDGHPSLPAIVVRASIRLPRSPRVRKRPDGD